MVQINNEKNDNALVKAFEESIYLDGLKDVAVDFAEIGLDELTKMVFDNISDAFLGVPIIKSVVSMGKLGWGIRNAVVLRNQLAFIKTLQQGDPDPKAVKKRIEALKCHEKWIEQEIETSVVFLDRYTHAKKAVYQARIYVDLLNGKINYKQYEEYLTFLDQLFLVDIEYLLDIVGFCLTNNKDFNEESLSDQTTVRFNTVKCHRLESLGLLQGFITMYPGTSTVNKYLPATHGYYLYTVFLEKDDEIHPKLRFEIGTRIE